MKNSVQSAYDFIIAQLQKTPPKKSLQAFQTATGGIKVVSSATIYVAGTAAELSTRNGNLIKAGLEPAPGVTNLQTANKLPAGMYLRVIGLRFLFEVTNGKTLQDAVWKSEAPANWKNSDFELTQNGDGRLFQSPITDLTNFRASTGNDDDFRAIEPVILRPDTVFDPKVTLAAGAVTDQLWRFEMRVEVITGDDK